MSTLHRRPRRKKTLLCVVGERPQVVTQSIYALATMAEPWVPDEVIAVTTKSGATLIDDQLFAKNRFARLSQAIGAHDIDFEPSNVKVICKSRFPHVLLDDIVTPEDNSNAGDFILDEVARITDDADTELRVCLAGERYSIGFFAGHALSLLGRSQDRLMHVLVDEVSHTDPEFFYPDIGTGNGASADGQISIADVPFARVERLVSLRLLAKRVDYATLCTALEVRPHLQVRNTFRGIVFTFSRAFDIPCDSSHRVPLPRFEPRAAALYAYYAWRAQNQLKYVSDEELRTNPEKLLEMYDACLLGGKVKMRSDKWRTPLSNDALASARSRIGRTLKKLIKDGAKYQAYKVQSCRNDRSYGLELNPEQIGFTDWSFADETHALQQRHAL